MGVRLDRHAAVVDDRRRQQLGQAEGPGPGDLLHGPQLRQQRQGPRRAACRPADEDHARRAQQDIEYLHLLAGQKGWDRNLVRQAIAAYADDPAAPVLLFDEADRRAAVRTSPGGRADNPGCRCTNEGVAANSYKGLTLSGQPLRTIRGPVGPRCGGRPAFRLSANDCLQCGNSGGAEGNRPAIARAWSVAVTSVQPEGHNSLIRSRGILTGRGDPLQLTRLETHSQYQREKPRHKKTSRRPPGGITVLPVMRCTRKRAP